MKEWAEVRDGPSDGASEGEREEITDRYQKKYASLLLDSDSKALQLDAVHQQHVQTNFNYKKKNIMQKLMEELQAAYYDVSGSTLIN